MLDGATNGRTVKLRFYNSLSDEEKIFEDRDYKPYFLLPYPLSEKDEKIVRSCYGTVNVIEKYDLFTGEKRKLNKVEVYNRNILRNAGDKFEKVWENEIEFIQGYVYDHGLVFGAPYFLKGGRFITTSHLPEELKQKFKCIFADVRKTDPLKHYQLEYWFNLCHQPIPRVKPETLGVKGDSSQEKNYVTFMLAKIVNLPVSEVYSSRRVSDWIKSIIYAHLRKRNILVPTSEELRCGEEPHTVPGALTVAPKSGAYFNMMVCDFESLYPSCIDVYNLSYETVNCNHKECRGNRISELDYPVCTKRRGFYSILIGALKDLRIHWFKPLSKSNSTSENERRLAEAASRLLKLITVSSYGVTVRIHGLACPPLAKAITGYGRWVLQTTWKIAEENGLHPTYGDTDSIFLDNPPTEKVQQLIKKVKEKLRLDLAIEKQYSVCVLSEAKKAYFGVMPDGTPEIKGLTVIKSNSPRFIEKVFLDCIKELSGVKNMKEYEVGKNRIVTVVEQAIDRLKRREVKIEDLAYSVRLYFDPNEKLNERKALHQPYQCAIQLLDSGREVRKRDTVSFIKVKPFNHKGRKFTVKPLDHVKNVLEINVEDYVRNMITALNQTFKPMGIKLQTRKERKISDWFVQNHSLNMRGAE